MIERLNVVNADCLVEMKRMIDAGVQLDSCVTDPPYHLTSIVERFGKKDAAPNQYGTDGAFARASKGFMGKEWDGGDIAFRAETWRLVYDLLKPGAYLVAFSATRNYHRMVCAIEDAGFDIRDQIAWIYGSGFPKSRNIGRDINNKLGAEREVVGQGSSGKILRANGQNERPFMEGKDRLEYDITAPASPEAQEWDGWGTALKPAFEPIVVARKPFKGSVADNVLKHRTGAINIGDCMIPLNGDYKSKANGRPSQTGLDDRYDPEQANQPDDKGRWPANVIHDGSDEVIAAFPDTETGGAPTPGKCDGGVFENRYAERSLVNHGKNQGNAARFFYSAKAQESDRMGSKHPTVKPIELMAYLCRLITPPGGHLLDPFAGSGSTGVAAIREGFTATLIEKDPESYQDILNRVKHIQGTDTPLFKA